MFTTDYEGHNIKKVGQYYTRDGLKTKLMFTLLL